MQNLPLAVARGATGGLIRLRPLWADFAKCKIRDKICRVQILLNQIGYPTNGTKKFVVDANFQLPPDFLLLDVNSQTRWGKVFAGKLTESDGDFGRYYTGNFSDFKTPGKYVIVVGQSLPTGYRSPIFRISADVYAEALRKGIEYFAIQRCGASTTGYHAPCHLDDGVFGDTGKVLDLAGGWHDASDLCKFSVQIVAIISLLHIAAASDDARLKERIFEEIQWGNLFFLKLQDEDGYIHDCTITENCWTDNIPGSADDRPVNRRKAVKPHLQHLFIMAQAELFCLCRDRDAGYARQCLKAAQRCFDRLQKERSETYVDFGTGAAAGWSLFAATGMSGYLDYAVRQADGFTALQQPFIDTDTLAGYFYHDENHLTGVNHPAYCDIDSFGLIGFCGFLEGVKSLMNISKWENALRLHCDAYLADMASCNAFGIVPFHVKLEPALVPGARTFRGCSYRYFMSSRSGKWWVGSNHHLAGTGIALCRAARILNTPEYQALAQRLLDWILGANPFNVSFINNIGHLNPPEYVSTEFQPRTPRIPGAVMLGICADDQDHPDLQAGSYHSGEYWTTTQAQTLWLMCDLMDGRDNKK